MKKSLKILIFLCAILITLACKDKRSAEQVSDKNMIAGTDRQNEVPKAVTENFKIMYPGENDPDWQQDQNGYWESNFKKDGEKYRADFNQDGSWIETENSIKKEDLSEEIKKIIEKDYSDYEITEVEHVNHHTKGEFYDVEFKRKGKNKDVEFRKNGEIIN